MSYETILLERTDSVATITLNRPQARNALDMPMREEIGRALIEVRDDDEIRALIITGAGETFCSGGDIRTMTAAQTAVQGRDRMRRLHRWLHELVALEKPVIAAVDGYAVGAGCNLALACDIILASDRAKFCESFVRVGLVPDMGGFFFLPRAVGLHKAKELVFTADMIDAAEAERIGLVNRVVPAASLMSEAMGLASRLARGATRAIGMAKVALNRSFQMDLQAMLDYEAQLQGIATSTEDHHEGVDAFLKKREPKFKGR